MKNFLFIAFSCLLLAMACKKETIEVVDVPTEVTPTDSLIAQADFVSSAHPTSGTVKLIEAANKQKTLVFENFKTDAGPDLRIYLATDKSDNNFTEITDEVKAGNYSLAVPANTDVNTKKFVLIWCEDFSVLFGYAELK